MLLPNRIDMPWDRVYRAAVGLMGSTSDVPLCCTETATTKTRGPRSSECPSNLILPRMTIAFSAVAVGVELVNMPMLSLALEKLHEPGEFVACAHLLRPSCRTARPRSDMHVNAKRSIGAGAAK